MKNNLEAITFTTYGYKHYTENLLASIKSNKVDLNLKVYALDKESVVHFSKTHKNVEDLKSDDSLPNYMKQNNNKFGELMFKKFECIYRSLVNSNYVLYVDSDITVKKNIADYLIRNIGYSDIIFQNDKRPSKPNKINMCAGFMFIKANKKTLKFFNPENVPIQKLSKYKTHDQTYINKNLAKFNYKALPLDLFPNGAHYYKYSNNIDPAIIHFNYIVGEKKVEYMKKYNEWYLDY